MAKGKKLSADEKAERAEAKAAKLAAKVAELEAAGKTYTPRNVRKQGDLTQTVPGKLYEAFKACVAFGKNATPTMAGTKLSGNTVKSLGGTNYKVGQNNSKGVSKLWSLDEATEANLVALATAWARSSEDYGQEAQTFVDAMLTATRTAGGGGHGGGKKNWANVKNLF